MVTRHNIGCATISHSAVQFVKPCRTLVLTVQFCYTSVNRAQDWSCQSDGIPQSFGPNVYIRQDGRHVVTGRHYQNTFCLYVTDMFIF